MGVRGQFERRGAPSPATQVGAVVCPYCRDMVRPDMVERCVLRPLSEAEETERCLRKQRA